MAVSHVLLAIDAEMLAWLGALGIDAPAAPSRAPTSDELLAALRELDTFEVELRPHARGWDAEVRDRDAARGWRTTVWVTSEGTRVSFHEGDAELDALIAERLARVCGPLVLVRNDDGQPAVVAAGADPIDVAAKLREA
jgi:hypothetical protein